MDRLPAKVALLLVLALSNGCDGLEAPPKQVGEPCTRSHQCEVGLACIAGECVVAPPPADASVDAAVDAATDAPSGG